LFLPPGVDVGLGVVCLAVVIGWAALLLNVRGMQAVHRTAVAAIASYASVPLSYTMQVGGQDQGAYGDGGGKGAGKGG
jgi:hypothetical protein